MSMCECRYCVVYRACICAPAQEKTKLLKDILYSIMTCRTVSESMKIADVVFYFTFVCSADT